MDDFEKCLEENLKDPEFAEEWESSAPARECMHAIIGARIEQKITQKELAKRAGVSISTVHKIEDGESNIKISTLQKIASGLGKSLHIEFI